MLKKILFVGESVGWFLYYVSAASLYPARKYASTQTNFDACIYLPTCTLLQAFIKYVQLALNIHSGAPQDSMQENRTKSANNRTREILPTPQSLYADYKELCLSCELNVL